MNVLCVSYVCNRKYLKLSERTVQQCCIREPGKSSPRDGAGPRVPDDESPVYNRLWLCCAWVHETAESYCQASQMDPDTGDKSEDSAKVSHLLPLLEWHMTVRNVVAWNTFLH